MGYWFESDRGRLWGGFLEGSKTIAFGCVVPHSDFQNLFLSINIKTLRSDWFAFWIIGNVVRCREKRQVHDCPRNCKWRVKPENTTVVQRDGKVRPSDDPQVRRPAEVITLFVR